jgi:hypothetical protein
VYCALDPVPEQEYLTREQLFEMKRPRREMPTNDDMMMKKFNRAARESRPAAPSSSGGGGGGSGRKRVRDRRGETRRAIELKKARTEAAFGGATIADFSQTDFSARNHSSDFATVGVNDRHVPRRTIVSHEVLVSSVYVNHRLYKLKSELLNIVALMADFGLYWEALSTDQSAPGAGRRSADMFIRFIQGAASPEDLMHAITTLETVIPLAGMTRGEHREVVEGLIRSAMAQSSAEALRGSVHKEPLPKSAITASSVAIRLFSLDRIIRYERLPAYYTEYLMKSATVCRTRCDHTARCPFSLYCNKMIGHFGRCMANVDTASRMPDIRPPFDRMVTGEMLYVPDQTMLHGGGMGGPVSCPSTQFSSLPVGDGGRVPMGHDHQGFSNSGMAMSKMNPHFNPHFAGASGRYALDRIEMVTIKVIPFDIDEVEPHAPEEGEMNQCEWV